MASPRVMKADHTRIGWTASTERQNGKWRTITTLSSYEANSPHGQKIIGVTADGPEATAVVYLTVNGAAELVKGLLMQMLTSPGGPITMTADEEFGNILKQCQTAIAREDEDSRQAVEAVRRSVANQLSKPAVQE